MQPIAPSDCNSATRAVLVPVLCPLRRAPRSRRSFARRARVTAESPTPRVVYTRPLVATAIAPARPRKWTQPGASARRPMVNDDSLKKHPLEYAQGLLTLLLLGAFPARVEARQRQQRAGEAAPPRRR